MWPIIFFAAATALCFRLFPLAFHGSNLLKNKDGRFYRFLNYSSQAMMGYIVFDSSFGQQTLTEWMHNLHAMQLLQLALLILCFVWVVYTQRLLSGLVLFMALYAAGIQAIG